MNKIALLLLAALGTSQIAFADPSLEVYAQGDFDGDFTEEVDDSDIEESPFTRSMIEISGNGTDSGFTYDYFASSDYDSATLRASGSLTNGTGAGAGPGELGLLEVLSILDDDLGLVSTLPGSYDVTVLLEVDGTITTSGPTPGSFFNPRAFANLSLGFPNQDSESYETNGTHDDVLSVTRTYNGNATLNIFASLGVSITELDPGETFSADFASSAVLKIFLPNGVSLDTSAPGASGLYNGDVQVVPIPASLPLLVAALGGLSFFRRHQDSRRP